MLTSFCRALLLFLLTATLTGTSPSIRSVCFDRAPRYRGCPVGTSTADSAYDIKYFYNTTSFSCQIVFYIRLLATSRSCMTNSQNMFDSELACRAACSLTVPGLLLPQLPALPYPGWRVATTTLTPEIDLPVVAMFSETRHIGEFRRDPRCFKPTSWSNFDRCRNYHPIYTYDLDLMKCVVFIYGGCLNENFNDGISNRFATHAECQRACIDGNELEQLPHAFSKPRIIPALINENALPSNTKIIPGIINKNTQPPTDKIATKRPPFMVFMAMATAKPAYVFPPDNKQLEKRRPRAFYSANPRCNSATYNEVYGTTACTDNPHSIKFQYNIVHGKCEEFFYTGCRQVIVNLFSSMWHCQKSCEEIQNTPIADPTCPPDSYIANCPTNPCDITGCPSAPHAECRPNFCGGCNARFFLNDQEIECSSIPGAHDMAANGLLHLLNNSPPSHNYQLTKMINIITETIPPPYPKSWSCLPGERLVLCPKNPCPTIPYCPRHPDAECRPNFCSGCRAEFYVRNVRVTCPSPPSLLPSMQ